MCIFFDTGKHTLSDQFRLNILVLCALLLCSCSSVKITPDTANPKPFEDNTKTLAPEPSERSSYVAYALIGFPRDLIDVPFSCIVALDQSIYLAFDETDITPALMTGGILGLSNWIANGAGHSWEFFLGNQYALSGFAAGWAAYIGWSYVGHPTEVLLLRYPYDNRWLMLGSRLKDGKEIRKLFFPNYQGLLGSQKRAEE